MFGVQGASKSSMLIRLKSSSQGLVVIGSISMPICNHFNGRLANNGQITTFSKYCSLMPSCAGFLEPRRSRLEPLKSTFNANNFIRCLSWSICSDFGAIRSWNVSHSQKSPKIHKTQGHPRSFLSVAIKIPCMTSYYWLIVETLSYTVSETQWLTGQNHKFSLLPLI